jgi:serine phosphatase RsbU (regulator of sigma subunit)
MTLRKQITIFVLLYCIGVVVVVSLVQYSVSRDHLFTVVQEKTSIIARAIAGAIDGGVHAVLAHSGAAWDPRYKRYLEYIRDIKTLFLEQSAANIYTIHYDEGASLWRYVLDDRTMTYDGIWVKSERFGFKVNCDQKGQIRVIHALRTNTTSFTMRVFDEKFDIRFKGEVPRQSLYIDGKELLRVREHTPLVLDTIAGEMDKHSREAQAEIELARKNAKIFLSFSAQGEPHSMPGERFVSTAAVLEQYREFLAGGYGNGTGIIGEKEDIWGEVVFVATAIIYTADGRPTGLVCVDVSQPVYSSYYDGLFISMTASILPLLAFVCIAFFIQGQRFVWPMFALDKAICQMTEKDNYSIRIDLGRIREYARISESFNLMTDRLSKYIEESKKSAATMRDIEIARSIQDAFMADEPPSSPFFEIACRHIPRRVVGGDSFCFHLGHKNSIGVLVSDVAGHGVPAALVSNMVRMAFDFGFSRFSSWTDKLLHLLNRSLFNKCMGERYVTACYTYLDFDKKRFSVSNAGHPPMIVYRSREDEFEMIKPRGIPLGCFSDARYKSTKFMVESKDRIILYTDGISGAQRSSDEALFGQNRFFEVIRESASLNAADLADKILSEAQSWRNREDDMTVVVIDIV